MRYKQRYYTEREIERHAMEWFLVGLACGASVALVGVLILWMLLH